MHGVGVHFFHAGDRGRIGAGKRRAACGQELARELEDASHEPCIMGDAVLPRSFADAILEGTRLGARI